MQNEIITNIKKRRSIRNYEYKKIEKEDLKEIIQAGRYAPPAKNDQPLKFITTIKKEIIKDKKDI